VADKGHVTEENLADLHKPGCCLSRHQKRAKGNLCSHQWQAQVKAEENSGIYNYPVYNTLCDWSPGGIFMSAARAGSRSGNVFPPDYAVKWLDRYWKEKPTHQGKEWDVGKNGNFEDYRKPYWNNAHHLIPNRALATAITDAADKAKEPRLVNLIRRGLLVAKYNLNDKINMVILPMEKIVAAALALPRHLKRDEVGPDEKSEFRSHEDYSRKVDNRLQPIIKKYKETLAKALDPEHEGPPDEISKEQLEELSKEIFSSIKKAGGFIGGKSLSELKF